MLLLVLPLSWVQKATNQSFIPRATSAYRDCWFSLFQVRQAGFSTPTPIQAQSWPIALQNLDIVAVAKTGSGKTLGYLIPGFFHLKRRRNNPQMGPTVLVLSPTRELATQIQDEAVKFGKSSQISCTVWCFWTCPRKWFCSILLYSTILYPSVLCSIPNIWGIIGNLFFFP